MESVATSRSRVTDLFLLQQWQSVSQQGHPEAPGSDLGCHEGEEELSCLAEALLSIQLVEFAVLSYKSSREQMFPCCIIWFFNYGMPRYRCHHSACISMSGHMRLNVPPFDVNFWDLESHAVPFQQWSCVWLIIPRKVSLSLSSIAGPKLSIRSKSEKVPLIQ